MAQSVADEQALAPPTTWSLKRADAYPTVLVAALRIQATHPDAAREIPEFVPPVRIRRYRSHLIIYRIAGSGIEVVRVVHAGRNWRNLVDP